MQRRLHSSVEAIDASDIGALVVAAEQEEVLGELELVAEQEEDGLEGLLSAIDVVAEAKVVGGWGEAAHFEPCG